MAASVLNLIESLETHLQHTQRELEQLRRENALLKDQLAKASAPQVQNSTGAGESQAAASLTPRALEKPVPDQQAPATPALEEPVTEQAAPATSDQSAQPEVSVSSTPSPHALLKQWYERYPSAFFKGHTKPLKVGIHQDLAQREPWSGKLIRRALANYVNLPRYVKSMREGAVRVDLDGLPAGKVDKEASLHANERRKDQVGDQPGPVEARQSQQKAPKKMNRAPEKSASTYSNTAEPNALKSEAPKKSDARKPLSMEEKIKGLMQKFEGR